MHITFNKQPPTPYVLEFNTTLNKNYINHLIFSLNSETAIANSIPKTFNLRLFNRHSEFCMELSTIFYRQENLVSQ